MLTFLKCDKAGHTDDGNLMFSLIAADGKRYEFAITTECFLRLFAMGWKAAPALGPAPVSGESPRLDGQLQFAFLDLAPSLTFSSGPLVLALPVSEELVTILQQGMARLKEMDKGPQH